MCMFVRVWVSCVFFILELNGNPSFVVVTPMFFSMKFNHNTTYCILFYLFNTNTFIIPALTYAYILTCVCERQCACFFFFFFVGVPILCASDLISFAYHRNLVFDSSKLEMLTVGCDMMCCFVLCWAVCVVFNGVENIKVITHSYRLFWNSPQNCQMEHKIMWRRHNTHRWYFALVLRKTVAYKRKLNHILQT